MEKRCNDNDTGSTMIYGAKCQAIMKQHIHKKSPTKIRMLIWMNITLRKNRLRNIKILLKDKGRSN